jgi:DNA (cytosine-5)-methyltransferase 1
VPTWPAEIASTLNAAFGDKQGLEDQHINSGAPLFVPDLSNALCARDYKGARPEADQDAPVIAFGAQNSAAQGDSVSTEVTPTLDKSKTPAVAQASAVRRLTPVECERLQGFPDDYTQIPWRNKTAESCPDGPRYKAMGNSMAVPVMRWIGERISMVDAL